MDLRRRWCLFVYSCARERDARQEGKQIPSRRRARDRLDAKFDGAIPISRGEKYALVSQKSIAGCVGDVASREAGCGVAPNWVVALQVCENKKNKSRKGGRFICAGSEAKRDGT